MLTRFVKREREDRRAAWLRGPAAAVERSRLRAARRPARFPALALAVFAGVLALTAFAAPALAQSATTFISNTGQASTSDSALVRATAFRTGNGTYTLSSVAISVQVQTQRPSPAVKIYEDDSGKPGDLLATMDNPGTLTNNAVNTFTDPESTTLSANTTYWLVTSNAAKTAGTGFRVGTIGNANLDSGTAAGWSIGNALFKITITDSIWSTAHDRIRFQIRGTSGTGSNTPPTVANAIQDQTALAGTPFSYTFPTNTFNDADATDTLTYSATKTDNNPLPTWLTFTAASRTFSGTPAASDVGRLSVKVIATDSSNASVSDEFDIVVSLINLNANVNEPPAQPAAPSVASTAGSTTSLDVTWSAPVNTGRPAIESYDLRYQKATETAWTNGPQDVTATSTTIASLDADTAYRVQVRATNDEGDSQWSLSGTGSTNAPPAQPAAPTVPQTMARPIGNALPVFSAPLQTREFAETVGDAAPGAAVDIGDPITATDHDGDLLRYSLEGTDQEAFTIIADTGQLRTKAGRRYDHEAQASYEVTVRADDGKDGTATVDVRIDVRDAPEPPLAPKPPQVRGVRDSQRGLQVTWRAPANHARPAITHYDLQYRPATASNWTDDPQPRAGLMARLEGLLPDTVYEVRVRAVNADGDSAWSEPGSGYTGQKDARAVQAWLTRFGRTVGTHVTDTVEERLRGALGQGSHLTIGGQRLPLGTRPEPAEPELGRAPGSKAAEPGSDADAPASALLRGLAGVLGLGGSPAGGTRPDPWTAQPGLDPRLGQSRTLDIGQALQSAANLVGEFLPAGVRRG